MVEGTLEDAPTPFPRAVDELQDAPADPLGAVDMQQGASTTLHALRATLRQADTQLRELESYWPPPAQQPTALRAALHVTAEQLWLLGAACLTIALVIGVRLYNLGTIQRDFYGDIQIVYQYVERVRTGQWPFAFVLGVGPLYQYLIAPLTLLTGLNYYGLKLGAVVVSLGALLATFLFTRRLVNSAFGLLVVVIAGTSSWLLIFSRLGISLILVPLLVALVLWLTVRIAQEQRPTDAIACGLIAALGLYAYPQSFVLPGVTLVTLLGLRWAGHPISWRELGRFLLATLVGSIPFMFMVAKAPEDFTQGYIGSKFVTNSDAIGALTHNLIAAAQAYHVRGDIISRSNPLYLPHLDPLSGLLLFAGIVFWLLPAQRRWSPVLIIPLLLLHLPSILVLGRPDEVPSTSRTIGVAPIIYVLVASGVWWIARALNASGRRRVAGGLTGVLLVAVVLLNMQRYFVSYIDGLPYHDTSIGGRIAAYADTLPPETNIVIVGCCWESAMPELPFVQVVAHRPYTIQSLDPANVTCESLQLLPSPVVLIWSFHDPIPAPQLAPCKQRLPAQLYTSPEGRPVFRAAPLQPE